MSIRVLLAALPVCFTLGCRSDRQPAYVVRDSVGIQIVENVSPRWVGEADWRLGDEPSLSIGEASEGAAEMLFGRIAGVFRLPDGGVAVVDAGASQVRIFGAAGAFIRSVGRPGGGPGEFQRIQTAGVMGDTIWVLDSSVNRLTFIDSRSGGLRSAPLEAQNLRAGFTGVLSDRSMVFAADQVFTAAVDSTAATGLQRFGVAFLRILPDGRTSDTVALLPGEERILRFGAGSVELLRPLFSRSASHVSLNDEILYGSQEGYEFRRYGLDGSLHGIVRWRGDDLSVTEELIGEMVEARVRAAPEPARPGLRRLYEDQPMPPSLPAYGRFLSDPDGYVWVEAFSPDGEGTSWSVFSTTGSWLGEMVIPVGFSPTQILSGEILGVWEDDLGVQYARAYDLIR